MSNKLIVIVTVTEK